MPAVSLAVEDTRYPVSYTHLIREQASQRSYENLEKILDALEKTKVRLRANVNTELALELLFLTIREK